MDFLETQYDKSYQMMINESKIFFDERYGDAKSEKIAQNRELVAKKMLERGVYSDEKPVNYGKDISIRVTDDKAIALAKLYIDAQIDTKKKSVDDLLR